MENKTRINFPKSIYIIGRLCTYYTIYFCCMCIMIIVQQTKVGISCDDTDDDAMRWPAWGQVHDIVTSLTIIRTERDSKSKVFFIPYDPVTVLLAG